LSKNLPKVNFAKVLFLLALQLRAKGKALLNWRLTRLPISEKVVEISGIEPLTS